METIIGYRVTYCVRYPWHISTVCKHFVGQKGAEELYRFQEACARRDNLFNNMPTLEEVVFLSIGGKNCCIGTLVVFD